MVLQWAWLSYSMGFVMVIYLCLLKSQLAVGFKWSAKGASHACSLVLQDWWYSDSWDPSWSAYWRGCGACASAAASSCIRGDTRYYSAFPFKWSTGFTSPKDRPSIVLRLDNLFNVNENSYYKDTKLILKHIILPNRLLHTIVKIKITLLRS